jgi:hypothetical protein
MPVIPAIYEVISPTWKVKVGRLSSKVSWGKSARPYLKNKLKEKGLGCGSSGRVPV